ncbi:hypothetical protein ACET3Z_002636 [Daucus carota]
MWVEDLHEKQTLPDLDTAILAINSAAAAKSLFEELVLPSVSTARLCSLYMFLALTWRLFAISVASLSTLIYVVLQFIRILLSCGSKSCIHIISTKLFSRTYKNVQFRCCQILYWPIFLQNSAHRSTSCVEYAEKAALRKHSMWSNLAVDVLFGNILGVLMLSHSGSVTSWTLKLFANITNYVLRMGCVSLMGNPAGFKLNNELAIVLGMLSLNAIQVWSTICFFMSSYFLYFIRGVAICGILFGLTTSAALIVDFITFATIHVRCLHWLISLIFSHQLQAVAALWRLFRDQKLNPLRQRLDSYDYTVDQHVVGSLLFTPVLLLLPTSSAFYIFFALMGTTVSFVCIFIELAISAIHATPYTKVFLWILMPRRFPSGLWVEIVRCQSDAVNGLETGAVGNLVLFLHSSCLNIWQVVFPHYKFLFSAVSRVSFATSMYGILIGRSLPSAMNNFSSSLTRLPMTLPWMSIPCQEYWKLCYDAVLARKECTLN